jgi:hypothetical protein
MASISQIVARAVVSGSVASVVTTTVLSLLSKAEGKGAVQPVNATSHWLHGPNAGAVTGADAEHTLVGYVTNHGAAVFWALLFEVLRTRRGRSDLPSIVKSAAAVSAVAAATDYGLVPKRLTPGWEHALHPSSVAAGFVALAAGLILGGVITGSRAPR